MAETPTIWSPTLNQEVEYSSSTALNIVDPTDSTVLLIDPSDSTIQIVDTGLTQTNIPGTVWTDDPGL